MVVGVYGETGPNVDTGSPSVRGPASALRQSMVALNAKVCFLYFLKNSDIHLLNISIVCTLNYHGVYLTCQFCLFVFMYMDCISVTTV